MSIDEYPEAFRKKLEAVTALRPKRVIDHILEHGYVTTADLREKFEYDHPPRGAQDVKDQGIPLETFKIKNENGKKVHAYKFGDPSQMREGMIGGRHAFPKALRTELTLRDGTQCAICSIKLAPRYLQIDHRIPYLVSGDGTEQELPAPNFMLLCGSCNRAKSWSCEHCKNGIQSKDASICADCYWANPRNYKHVATMLLRRLDIVWQETEIPNYEKLSDAANNANVEIPEYVKNVLKAHVTEFNETDDRP